MAPGPRQIATLVPGSRPLPPLLPSPQLHTPFTRVLGGRVADCRDPGTWARMRLGARPEGRSSPGTIWCALHHALARWRPKAPSHPHRPRCDDGGPHLTPAVPWLTGTTSAALATCFIVLRATWLRWRDEEAQGGCGEQAPIRRARRLMGWEGGYFLRSEIKKERDA